MALSLVTAPVGEPVSVSEAKQQLQQFTNVDDALISRFLIPAARERCETATRRALLTQTWDLLLDAFPDAGWIEIPKPPLVSVSWVKYTDMQGTTQTLTVTTDYLVQAPAGPRCRRGRIALPYSTTWPTAIPQMGAVQIRFVCGYGASATAVPTLLRQAMLLDIGTLYADRENLVTGASVAPLPWGAADIYRAYRSMPTVRVAA